MANLLDSASILLTPTATNNGSILAVKPENGSGDMTFSRGSSATRVNAQGLVENVASNLPRIDYTDGCGSLLLEPQSTNLITQSENFSDASWFKTRGTVLPNQAISPDGNLTADKFTEIADTGFHAISVNTTVISGVSHTFSVFIKKGSINFIQFLFGTNNVNGDPYVNFDVNQGIYQNNGTTSANIENYGNGWYKCSVTFTTATTSFNNYISPIQSISDSRVSTFLGNVNNNFYIYGAQEEQQSYPTSYIPTQGAISTRLQDIATNSGNASLINSEEGVLYAEMASSVESGTDRAISLFKDNSNTVSLFYFSAVNTIRAVILNNGSTQVSMDVVLTDVTDFNKIALKYKENDVALYVNGIEESTDTNCTIPTGLISLDFNFANSNFYGKNKAVAVYKTALTDEKLTLLTTI